MGPEGKAGYFEGAAEDSEYHCHSGHFEQSSGGFPALRQRNQGIGLHGLHVQPSPVATTDKEHFAYWEVQRSSGAVSATANRKGGVGDTRIG